VGGQRGLAWIDTRFLFESTKSTRKYLPSFVEGAPSLAERSPGVAPVAECTTGSTYCTVVDGLHGNHGADKSETTVMECEVRRRA